MNIPIFNETPKHHGYLLVTRALASIGQSVQTHVSGSARPVINRWLLTRAESSGIVLRGICSAGCFCSMMHRLNFYWLSHVILTLSGPQSGSISVAVRVTTFWLASEGFAQYLRRWTWAESLWGEPTLFPQLAKSRLLRWPQMRLAADMSTHSTGLWVNSRGHLYKVGSIVMGFIQVFV